jgi:hypothetical protein
MSGFLQVHNTYYPLCNIDEVRDSSGTIRVIVAGQATPIEVSGPEAEWVREQIRAGLPKRKGGGV